MTLHRRWGDVVLTSCACWVLMCLYELILPAVIVECGYLQTLESDSATWLKISFRRWTYLWLLKICSTTIPIYQLYVSAIETLQYEGHVPTGIIVCDIVLKWCLIFRMFISDRYQSMLDWFYMAEYDVGFFFFFFCCCCCFFIILLLCDCCTFYVVGYDAVSLYGSCHGLMFVGHLSTF